MMIRPKSLVWAAMMIAAPFLSHGSSAADSLPPVLTSWDTTKALPSIKEAMRLSTAGKETTLHAASDRRQLYILVIGASCCRPCRYQDKLLHQAAGNWDYSRFKIVHLSIDTDKKTWKDSEKKAGYQRTAFLLQGSPDSALTKTLDIAGVPRYLVVDDQGKVVIDNSGGIRMMIRQLNEKLRWQEAALARIATEWCESVY